MQRLVTLYYTVLLISAAGSAGAGHAWVDLANHRTKLYIRANIADTFIGVSQSAALAASREFKSKAKTAVKADIT